MDIDDQIPIETVAAEAQVTEEELHAQDDQYRWCLLGDDGYFTLSLLEVAAWLLRPDNPPELHAAMAAWVARRLEGADDRFRAELAAHAPGRWRMVEEIRFDARATQTHHQAGHA